MSDDLCSYDVEYMVKKKAVFLNKNEKTVRDIIEGFINLLLYSHDKRNARVIIVDDKAVLGPFKLLDKDIRKYFDKEVSHAYLQYDEFIDDEVCLKVYLKSIIRKGE